MKASEILLEAAKDIDNAEIRVYENGEMAIMAEGYDSIDLDAGGYAIISEDEQHVITANAAIWADNVDADHPIQVDEDGARYVSWRNGDFSTPYDEDNFADRIEYYERFGN